MQPQKLTGICGVAMVGAVMFAAPTAAASLYGSATTPLTRQSSLPQPPWATRSGHLTLTARRISGGRLRVRATAIITTRRVPKHRLVPTVAAQLYIFSCTATWNPFEIPLTGPVLFNFGEEDRAVTIRGTAGKQTFRLSGIADVGQLGGGWTDCAQANIYTNRPPYVVFWNDALVVLTEGKSRVAA